MIADIKARGQSTVFTGAVMLGLAATLGIASAADRVIFAVDPIQTETNIFWEGVGDRVPGAQALIGHDPMTGEYTNNELAESWEQSDGYTTWTVRLHPNAEFHFGWGPVTAEDVIFSYEMSTSAESTAVGRERIAGATVTALDERTVEFRYPDARFDLVAVTPAQGNAAEVAIESTKARRNAESVLRTLTAMGLEQERIDLSYSKSDRAAANEVHLFVK